MVQIRCPKCQTLLVVDDSMAGSMLTCPDCATAFRVPGLEPPPVVSDIVKEEDRPPSPFRRRDEPIDEESFEDRPEDAEVLRELERQQNQKPGWGNAIAILMVSLILFMGAARTEQMWSGVALFVVVIGFHELGHYAAMRLFGYRNVRMFFIPFFGAAVSGRHYNVEGWKKAVVALAGPVPGIVLGMPVAVAGVILGEPLLIEAAFTMLILNGFNLLPFLPLDGGWVVHATLFVRHPVLDVVFRVAAALCLLGVAILLMAWCLIAVAIFMLLAAPMAYRQATIAHRLRDEGLAARTLDADSIPPEAARQILAELRRVMPANTPPSMLAQHVANIFEMFNAEPPGVIVTIALLTVHAACFLGALVMFAVLSITQHPPAGN
jgi:Zn-dependent protease